jgi:hypothetical protein
MGVVFPDSLILITTGLLVPGSVGSLQTWMDNMFTKLRSAALSALAVTLVFAACENTDQLTSPSLHQKAGSERVVVTEYGDQGYKMVQETDPTVGTVTAVIDENGGSLSIGGTTLAIPAGAVSGATTFTVNKPNGELAYDFSATQQTPNDVGSAGFAVPLTLTISYAGVGDRMAAPVIVYINDRGRVVPLATKVNTAGRTMTAEIRHFSIYGGADTLLGFVFGLLGFGR